MTETGQGGVYREIGVTPVINAIGSVTLLGGSRIPDEVTGAMDRANEAYVPMAELQAAAGSRAADLAGVPAAYVTSGAASALTLAAAACMAGDDDTLIERLPDPEGMPCEFLIQTRQRHRFDRCLEFSGGRLAEFGTPDRTTGEDLDLAIGPQTAAIHYLAMEQAPDPSALSLEATIEIAQKHGVPIIVDAAGQVYPTENIGKYVRMGADVQCVATKYIGSPHSTGLALGTEEFIRKLSLQSFVSYESRAVKGVGRPQKIDRQEVVGTVVALQRWMTLDHEQRLANDLKISERIVDHLADLPGVAPRVNPNVIGQQAYGVIAEIEDSAGISPTQLTKQLRSGDPPIWTLVDPKSGHLVINTSGLLPGQENIVGSRIRELVLRA